MFVVRRSRTVKKDKVYEYAQYCADTLAERAPHGYRVYTQGFGPRDAVILEVELESFAELEEIFGEIIGPPKNATPEFLARWAEIGIPGGTDEIWNVYASRK